MNACFYDLLQTREERRQRDVVIVIVPILLPCQILFPNPDAVTDVEVFRYPEIAMPGDCTLLSGEKLMLFMETCVSGIDSGVAFIDFPKLGFTVSAAYSRR